MKIEEEITNKAVTGFVTAPYTTTLDKYTKQSKISEKEALVIFDQIVKAVYSLYVSGFQTKNLRAQHFVLSKKVWKL